MYVYVHKSVGGMKRHEKKSLSHPKYKADQKTEEYL